MKKILVILLLMVNAFSFASVAFADSDFVTGNHPPIYINGNEEFTPENGVTGGNGTAENPYRIENWTIVDDDSAPQGIFINNTDVHFVIRNCTISGFHDPDEFRQGIQFFKVQHGTIDETCTLDCAIGAFIWYSKEITVANSTFRDHPFEFGYGINIVSSSHITIDSISCCNMEMGIWIIESINISIRRTTCSDNLIWGLVVDVDKLQETELRYSIEDCEFSGNGAEGIIVFSLSGSDITIRNSSFFDQDTGIKLEMLTLSSIENCSFLNNELGIFLDRANNVRVTNCRFENNSCGIEIGGFLLNVIRGVEVSSCTFKDNLIGIWLLDSMGCTIHHCILVNNSYIGLISYHSIARIYSNNIVNNGRNWTENIDPAGVYNWQSFLDVRQNWWGSSEGPCVSITPVESVIQVRKIEGSDVLMKRLGFARFRPWSTVPVPDAGRQT
jgi:parallel beta-helix repeat protein